MRRKDLPERVAELLRLVGLSADAGDRYPHEFSGGQQQRIGIARAIAVRPACIVWDEPVSSLDVSIQAQIINLLTSLQQQFATSYVFIAHDLATVRHISDRVAVMYLGRIVESAERETLFALPSHPYTVALLSAVPTPDPVVERSRKRIVLTGDVPNPADAPSGCHFHPRCWLRLQLGNPQRCESEAPDLRKVASGQFAACHFAEEIAAGRASQDPLVGRTNAEATSSSTEVASS